MYQPVYCGGGGHRVFEYFFPLGELKVAGDQGAVFFIPVGKEGKSNSSRQPKEDLQTKIDRIEDRALRSIMEEQVRKWYHRGWNSDPLTVSTPQCFTFRVREGKSIWAFYYVSEVRRSALNGTIEKNSIVIQIDNDKEDSYIDIINWVTQQRNHYILESDNKGKTRDYYLYCIDVNDYSSEELYKVFDKLHEIALMKQKGEL